MLAVFFVESLAPTLTKIWPWVLRTSWIVLPFTLGQLIGQALQPSPTTVQRVAVVLAWGLWVVGCVATLAFHPIGLLYLRLASLLAVLVAVGAATEILANIWSGPSGEVTTLASALGLATSGLAFVCAHHADSGQLCVNGPAYPNERRFLLRPPATHLLLLLPISALTVCLAAIVGPMRLANQRWLSGAIFSVIGALLIWVLVRPLYVYARRFVVFVPAGFVLHDETVLREPVLFRRQAIDAIRLAPADSDSLDLTVNASGLAVEVVLLEKVEVTKISGPRDAGQTGGTARFLVVPTLPGRVIAEAASRRIDTI